MNDNKILENVEALLKTLQELRKAESRNREDDNSQDDVVPETARPFQAISFSKNIPLSISEVLNFFDRDQEAVSEFPWKPEGGTVVLFKAKTLAENEDWRSNGHRFKQINGGRYAKDGLIRRREGFLQIEDNAPADPRFKMISWTNRDKPLYTLVQFVGDSSLSVDRPHGRSKKNIVYHRSAPSLLRKLEIGSEKPFKEYQKHVFDAPPDVGTHALRVPRDITQVRNAQQRFKRMNKGTDSFSNLNRISLESEDVRFLMTVPDLVMVNCTKEMLNQAREILALDYDKAQFKQLVGYDTQFELGDYYVSWISMRDIRFRNKKSLKSPVIPVIQVIHERKYRLHHDLAWSIVTDLIPEICSKKFLAVSDDEFTPVLEKVRQRLLSLHARKLTEIVVVVGL